MTLRVTVTGAKVGDKLRCPGCDESLTLDWADGWTSSSGLTCSPPWTTHSDHITTRMASTSEIPQADEPCSLCGTRGHESHWHYG
ncbi:hypothetical protein M2280_004096 [Prescottella agglutinans]|uniref:Uncharacterized protein n=1 Tax=Prescottella agglutinans TaxID=1644129 RepID=A0ABT6MEW3_9NOCA|nr:hypothetical protein [Prescottella agglutinans]